MDDLLFIITVKMVLSFIGGWLLGFVAGWLFGSSPSGGCE